MTKGVSILIALLGLSACIGQNEQKEDFEVYEFSNGKFSAQTEMKCTFVGNGATKDEAIDQLRVALEDRRPTTCRLPKIISTTSGKFD